jgi:hypothetical protein
MPFDNAILIYGLKCKGGFTVFCNRKSWYPPRDYKVNSGHSDLAAVSLRLPYSSRTVPDFHRIPPLLPKITNFVIANLYLPV